MEYIGHVALSALETDSGEAGKGQQKVSAKKRKSTRAPGHLGVKGRRATLCRQPLALPTDYDQIEMCVCIAALPASSLGLICVPCQTCLAFAFALMLTKKQAETDAECESNRTCISSIASVAVLWPYPTSPMPCAFASLPLNLSSLAVRL